MRASVKKIVQPTGIATAIMFLPTPRVKKALPSVLHKFFTVSKRGWFVLNISLRMTSSGLVSAAPATPAHALLVADLQSRSESAVGELGSTAGKTFSIQSFTSTAVQYFGTVFNIPADVPCHKLGTPPCLWICFNADQTLLKLDCGSCNVIAARTIGILMHCTPVDTTSGGMMVATNVGTLYFDEDSSSFPLSEPQKMAARAQVIPKTVATIPLYGGANAYTYGDKDGGKLLEATLKPD
mmetsp:Transcript_25354/g.38438  ORF Transcript_25354/g.38438 Transcript_25354/m.38438 type:complete len:239 (+) Transcript_25354:133-849(+)